MANKWGPDGVVEWHDRKRILGMPISFTVYDLVSTDEWTKICIKTGILFTREEEINLYRIHDIALSSSLGQKIFGVGTIWLYSNDESTPNLKLVNVKNPSKVRNMIASKIEEEKAKRGFRVGEFNY